MDIDDVIFKHLKRLGVPRAWSTPGEIANGDPKLAQKVGLYCSRHCNERKRGSQVLITDRKRERVKGRTVIRYKIVDKETL